MPSRTVKADGPHPVDVHIGERIRMRRDLLGMKQDVAASALGVNYKQLQKYEKGTNRISASRLYLLSQIFEVPVSYFYDGLGAEITSKTPADIMIRPETMELVRTYYRVEDAGIRRSLLELMRTLMEKPGD